MVKNLHVKEAQLVSQVWLICKILSLPMSVRK